MRKLLASILFAFTILTGCAEPEIIISDLSAETFPADGGTLTFSFTSSGPWVLEDSSENVWIDFDLTTGEAGEATVKATADANYTGTTRTSSVRISTEGAEKTIAFSQESVHILEFNLGDMKAELDAAGGRICICVEDGVDYEVTINDSWIKPVHKEGARFYYEIAANTDGERMGMLLFCGDMTCRPFTIIQK